MDGAAKVTMEQLAARMGRVGHFRDLAQEDRRRIVEGGTIRRFDKGELIFQQSSPCAGMFVLLSGKVRLCRISPRGQEQIVTQIQPVIMFNEVAVLDGKPNPVTAIAEENCLTWNVGYESFQGLVRRYPEVGLGLLRVLAARNRLLVELCADLSFRPVLARLAKLLLDLSENGGITIDRGEHPIQQLSSRIATAPEAISRSLTMLKEQDVIEASRAYIKVLRPETLAELAQVGCTSP
jgi:CRP/FNR family transcriptional regulator